MEIQGKSSTDLPDRPEIFEFEGISMVEHFTKNWENVKNFQARPDDILIATYPKAGTTWVSNILDLLYFGKEDPKRQTTKPIYKRVPFLESCFPEMQSGTELANNLPTSPRLIKTHLPVQLVPQSFWEKNSRVAYVARNAKDNAVSYFHFNRMNKAQPEPGDWNTFLEEFMKGKMVFGSWFDHVCGWWEKKKTYPNLHYMLYEDMAKDIKGEVESLCTFLKLSRSDEEKEKIINGIQFDAMKQNKMTNYSTVLVMDFTISPFMRKGKVGDWKNHFTVAQNEQFNEDYKQKMKNSTLKFPTEHGRKTRGGRGRHVPSHPRLVPPPQKRKNLNYKKKNLNCEKYTYIYLK
ncbi:sulfotransferase family 1, cytosolic sulfotransferase 9 [Danio rerio]|uniref:Sulfotransferase n=1 Tax=Danio rerio TaxID=7955 RepID=A0AB13A8R3_DANRE|nr:sulfotransferase family 1, cytosolic sulfotransferase 9 [Danio rerio]|eukprot:XP_009302521.1 cytosolic sulfotransferase 3 isoform X1 [Danio rerio]